MNDETSGGLATVLPFRSWAASSDADSIRAMPEALIEQLADLWCAVLLESLNRRPIEAEPDAA